MNIPRILFTGTASGSGKTTAVCVVEYLLAKRMKGVRAFKCGPDYIDPMFHSDVLGIPATNLDPFFCDRELMRFLLCDNAGQINVIEGVMGYYDGSGENGTDNSTFWVADKTDTPVILVVDAKGAAASLLATIEGFVNFVPESRICAVLFNRMSAGTYECICRRMKQRFGETVLPVGFMPVFEESLQFPSRHLGLFTAAELPDLQQRISRMAERCEKTIDIERIVALANSARMIDPVKTPLRKMAPIHLAYACDEAFCFYYHDTLKLFEKTGAKLLRFSPLKNEPVPSEADGLLLGGGYPELYAEKLGKNRISAESIRKSVENGMPVIAECGGFQYLGKSLDGEPMCGVLAHESRNSGKLVRFGYVTLTSKKQGVFGHAGVQLKAHEFHYWDSTDNGEDFLAQNLRGKQYAAAVTTETMYAGYPHLYLPAAMEAAQAFYCKCLDYQKRKKK